MAKYLGKKYGFIVINLLYLFKNSDDNLMSLSPKKPNPRDGNNGDDESSISTVSSSLMNDFNEFDEDLLRRMNTDAEDDQDSFSFEYYQGMFTHNIYTVIQTFKL